MSGIHHSHTKTGVYKQAKLQQCRSDPHRLVTNKGIIFSKNVIKLAKAAVIAMDHNNSQTYNGVHLRLEKDWALFMEAVNDVSSAVLQKASLITTLHLPCAHLI